jgi:predicted nucleic acid-binding protein
MTAKYFLDTNFLVYLFSENEIEKRDQCRNIFKNAGSNIHFVVSTQVLKEFTAAMIGKFKMQPMVAKSIIDDLNEFEVIQTNTFLIKQAIDIHILHQLSFWDSLIICAAKSANCSLVLTEDMNDGQLIEGVKIQHPFTF